MPKNKTKTKKKAKKTQAPVAKSVSKALAHATTQGLDYIDIGLFDDPPVNANVMETPDYAMLVNNIKVHGFLLPVTARPSPKTRGRYELIGGVHRVRAAREVGLPSLPALVVPVDDTKAAAIALALNKIHGSLDLGTVGDVLRELAEAGFSDLTLTGFNGGDIQDLLKDVAGPTALDDLGPGAGAGGGDETEGEKTAGVKRYGIHLRFDRPEDRDRVKAAALAAGPTVEAGILALCP